MSLLKGNNLSRYEPCRVIGVVNDTVSLGEDFIDGKPFSLELSRGILRTFDLERKIESTIPPTGKPFKGNYSEMLKRLGNTKTNQQSEYSVYLMLMQEAKQFLSDNKPIQLKKDIIYLETEKPISKILTALVVRLINIAHRGQFIIVLNGGVLYVPESLRSRDKEEFGRYVKLAILEHQDKTKAGWIKSLKKNSRLLVSQMMKTVVTA